jgi:hypothetical protein
LIRTNLQGANVNRVIAHGVELDGAVWPNGHICAAGSIGICK